ncbi:MAG TPA: PaaI family thioesterase [Acidimicrobiales bacterium]|jgi:acyl-coenzyme A thioesterase PaaI-like protein
MADLPADPSAPPGPRIAGPGSPEWPEALRHFAEAPVSPRRTEMHRMGDALRRIIERLHGSPAPDAELRSAADDLERLADRLDAFPNSSVYEGFSEATVAGADPHAFFDHSPMLGRANPLAPPIELWADGDTMRGRVSFGSTYEGPPGCVHGGYVAAAFDEVLGSTQSLAGRPGMTGRLTVHYRSPTPLHADLRFAARVVEVSGRKTLTHGTLHAGDRLCAEAEGLFIAIDFTKMVELRRRRDEALGSVPDQGE